MTTDLYDYYKKYYDLKKFKLNLSKKKIILLIYDDKYNYYFDNNNFIATDKIENILSIITELKQKYDLEIINFYPLCYCNDTLIICFKTKTNENNILNIINYKNIDKYKSKLITYHRSIDITLYVSFNIKKEIYASQKYQYRYKFHEKFIKKYILTRKQRKKDEFKELLRELIPNKKTIIDISCGDSQDAFLIAKEKKYDMIVANDIGIKYLYTHKDLNIVYTNENIEKNFISNLAYDVSFCKNTLHHMNDIVCIKNLLDFMKRISNEIIVIEIINPYETGGLPKFLHKYLYSKFLKDVGKCFLNEDQFVNIINDKFSNEYNIKYKKFKNILGEYIIAKITKK